MILKELKTYSEHFEITIVADGSQLEIEYPNWRNNIDQKTVEKVVVNTDNIYRPIQYLGAKHRPLPIILSKTLEAVKPNTYVLDMFSGSSVVAQTFNSNGLNVISNDVLRFNSAFSKSLLNIDRKTTDLEGLEPIIQKIKVFKLADEHITPFRKVILEEAKLLMNKQTENLLTLYSNLPQVNKVLFLNGSNTHNPTQYIIENIGKSAFNNYPLIANYYSGSYFGIFQALELDRIRNAIEHLKENKDITKWQYNFLLTCLLNVTSKIVYTAGKHFAQPIKQENILKTSVLHKRFYEDRLKNVWDEFLKSFNDLIKVSSKNIFSKSNLSFSNTMENIIKRKEELPPISVIYADPPYTAQQYSRYYHIPEVIFNYSYPQLQVVDDKVTSGLYPNDKFKSRFCSKREAYNAFTDLFKLSAELRSSLIISYSSSLSTETGNLRMITLEQILNLGNEFLPECSVEILKFNFKYRQLNTSKKIVQSKDDKEFLIVFKQCNS